MTSMKAALEQSGHVVVVGYLAKKEAERKVREERVKVDVDRKGRAEARRLRDEAISQIHSLSYSRKNKDGGGKLVPRRKENREALARAMQAAKVYASLARPEHGYPRPPRVYDEQYPKPENNKRMTDFNRVSTERNRLTFWLSVLQSRGACDARLERIAAHIARLERKLVAMSANTHIRKRPGTKEYTMRPAPTHNAPRNPVVVQIVRSLSK